MHYVSCLLYLLSKQLMLRKNANCLFIVFSFNNAAIVFNISLSLVMEISIWLLVLCFGLILIGVLVVG